MTDTQIDEIRKRVEKATKGVWTAEHNYKYEETRVFIDGNRRAHLDGRELLNQVADGDFIAHSRSDIEYLLSKLDAAERMAKEIEADSFSRTRPIKEALTAFRAVGKETP